MSKPEFEASVRAEVEAILRARLGEMEKTLAQMHHQVEQAFSTLRSESASRIASVGDDAAIAAFAERTVTQLTAAAAAVVPVPVPVEAIADPSPAPAAEPVAPGVDLRELRRHIIDIEAQQTQADVLNLLVAHAASFAPRVALFIVKAGNVVGWASRGFEDSESNALRGLSLSLQSDTLLRAVLEKQDSLTASSEDHADNRLLLEKLGKEPREISGIPLLVRGKAAAVLYVDSGDSDASATHLAPIEILVNIAGFTVELISARSRAASVAPTTTGVPAVAPSVTQNMPTPVAEEVKPEPVAEEIPEPVAETAPEAEETAPEEAPQAVEAAAEPEPTPDPEPVAGDAPSYYTAPAVPQFVVEPEPAVEATPEVEAEAAPEAAPEEKPVITHSFPPVSMSYEAEPVAEAPRPEPSFTFQPEPETRPEPSFTFQPEPVAEVAEPVAETPEPVVAEPEARPEPSFSFQPEPETRPEPSFSLYPEPVAEPPVPSFSVQPEPEAPAPEPSPVQSDPSPVGFSFTPSPIAEESRPVPDFSATQAYTSFEPPVVAEAPAVEPPRFEIPSPEPPKPPATGPLQAPPVVNEEDQKAHTDARRFARLLVSEIKLYNEQKVLEGRQNNDLYDRLREDIDRSRQMYDKRITNPVVITKFDYFHDEMVASLAEGDVNKLGRDCPGPQIHNAE